MFSKFVFICFFVLMGYSNGSDLQIQFTKQKQFDVKVKAVCLASFFSFAQNSNQTVLCTPIENDPPWKLSVIDKISSPQERQLVVSPDPDKLLMTSDNFIYVIDRKSLKIIDKISPDIPEKSNWSISSFLEVANDAVYFSIDISAGNNKNSVYKGKFPLLKNNFSLERLFNVYPWTDHVLCKWRKSSQSYEYSFFSGGKLYTVPTQNFSIDLNKQMTYQEFKQLRKLKNKINRSDIRMIDFDEKYGWLISRNGLDEQTGMRFDTVYHIKPSSSGYSVVSNGYNAFWGPAGEIYFFKETQLIVLDKRGKEIPVYNFAKSSNNNVKPNLSSDRRFLAILSSEAELMIFDLKNKQYITESLPKKIVRIGNTNGLFHFTNVCGVFY